MHRAVHFTISISLSHSLPSKVKCTHSLSIFRSINWISLPWHDRNSEAGRTPAILRFVLCAHTHGCLHAHPSIPKGICSHCVCFLFRNGYCGGGGWDTAKMDFRLSYVLLLWNVPAMSAHDWHMAGRDALTYETLTLVLIRRELAWWARLHVSLNAYSILRFIFMGNNLIFCQNE